MGDKGKPKASVPEKNNDVPSTSSQTSTQNETRPIMLLFERLISTANKHDTCLTNVQINAMLQNEFNMDVKSLHPLEISIYLNVVKRFLKDWPQWDEFDRIIVKLKKKNDTRGIKNALENKYYNDFKEYLQSVLDETRPLAQKAVEDLAKEKLNPLPKFDTNNIALEICCTRKQLNKLIFDKPHPDFNNTIFNLPSNDQKTIIKDIPVISILNYPDVKISIDLKFFTYSRNTKHELKHKLVNGALNAQEPLVKLNTDIQRKMKIGPTVNRNKNEILSLLDNLIKSIPKKERSKISGVLNFIKSDFEVMGHDVKSNVTIVVPGLYRQYNNKYPYYRKLFTRVETEECEDSLDFDLYIKETILPMHIFDIGKVGQFAKKRVPPNFSWIKIECLLCKVSFTNENFNEELVAHFKKHHTEEPDWRCTNCDKSFKMIDLAFKKWRHICEVAVAE